MGGRGECGMKNWWVMYSNSNLPSIMGHIVGSPQGSKLSVNWNDSQIPTKTIPNPQKNKSWFGNTEQVLRHSCNWQAVITGQTLSTARPFSYLCCNHHSLGNHQGSGRRTETGQLQQTAVLFLAMFIAGMFPGIDTDLSKTYLEWWWAPLLVYAMTILFMLWGRTT